MIRKIKVRIETKQMIRKIKVRIETKQIGYNFTHDKEYLVKHLWAAGYTVICDNGDERYVPKGYVDELIETPSCPAGEVRGEKCDPCECPEPDPGNKIKWEL